MMAETASGVAPFAFSTSSKLLAVPQLDKLLAGRRVVRPADFATFVTFSGIMRTSIDAKGALGADAADGRVGDARRAGRRRPGWCASAGAAAASGGRRLRRVRRRLQGLDDLGLRLGQRQFARRLRRVRRRRDRWMRNVTSASSCTGPGSGARVGGFGAGSSASAD